ncbi:DUF6030 family protein [Neorhizobium sp. NCHU2750]|uniref:DUF6030 family protein n=1 Tax=Neorhizobium sp. NCHU2750 TaxID=1825976 RepID=UPI000E71AF19|nr:hypothetical protein NCHU2750_11520 [Neorhizobium sp. NCHU2750]
MLLGIWTEVERIWLADKAEILTPMMRLRRRRRAMTLFIALLAVGLVSLVGIVLAVNDGRNYHRLVIWLGMDDYLARPIATPPPQPLRSHRTALIVDMPKRLTEPRSTGRDRFELTPRFNASERCARLAPEGDKQPPTFQTNNNEWECLYAKQLGHGADPSVLFVQIKGTASDAFRTFRLKLSLLDPSQNAATIQLALQAVERFGLEMTPESRRYLRNRINEGRSFASTLANYRIVLEREREDDRRYNILILPLPASVACGSAAFPSGGAVLNSQITPTPIGCLQIPQPRPLRPIEPN